MLTLLVASAWAWNGYYRQPDLHGDTVVFAADGDLWTVPASGGTAHQLTANPGHDGSPFLSPDGALVAYTSDLDGGVDVYVVPVGGGEPRRLTWHPAGDETAGGQFGDIGEEFGTEQLLAIAGKESEGHPARKRQDPAGRLKRNRHRALGSTGPHRYRRPGSPIRYP